MTWRIPETLKLFLTQDRSWRYARTCINISCISQVSLCIWWILLGLFCLALMPVFFQWKGATTTRHVAEISGTGVDYEDVARDLRAELANLKQACQMLSMEQATQARRNARSPRKVSTLHFIRLFCSMHVCQMDTRSSIGVANFRQRPVHFVG